MTSITSTPLIRSCRTRTSLNLKPGEVAYPTLTASGDPKNTSAIRRDRPRKVRQKMSIRRPVIWEGVWRGSKSALSGLSRSSVGTHSADSTSTSNS